MFNYRVIVASMMALTLSASVFATTQSTSSAPQALAANAVTAAPTSATSVQSTKINLNKATLKELMSVKGLTKVKSKNIIAYRHKHGDFKSIEDLKLVKGFKRVNTEKMKDIQDQLTIE